MHPTVRWASVSSIRWGYECGAVIPTVGVRSELPAERLKTQIMAPTPEQLILQLWARPENMHLCQVSWPCRCRCMGSHTVRIAGLGHLRDFRRTYASVLPWSACQCNMTGGMTRLILAKIRIQYGHISYPPYFSVWIYLSRLEDAAELALLSFFSLV